MAKKQTKLNVNQVDAAKVDESPTIVKTDPAPKVILPKTKKNDLD